MRETRRNCLGVALVVVCVRCGCAHGLWMKCYFDWVIELKVRQQERVRKGKNLEKRKEGEKWFEEKRASFCFCVTMPFTQSFPLPFNPLCHHSSSLRSYTPTIVHFIAHTTRRTSMPVFCPLSFFLSFFLCV